MRVRELEMLRKQVDTMQQYKQNWMEKQQQLQKTISELERHSQMEHERLESELVLQTETAELALLDKQVAEEKVRSGLEIYILLLLGYKKTLLVPPTISPALLPPMLPILLQARDLEEQIEEHQDRIEELMLQVEIYEAEREVSILFWLLLGSASTASLRSPTFSLKFLFAFAGSPCISSGRERRSQRSCRNGRRQGAPLQNSAHDAGAHGLARSEQLVLARE